MSENSSFFMASDGQVAFQDYKAEEDFLGEFSSDVSDMDLRRLGLRIDSINSEQVVFRATYTESLRRRDGILLEFSGFVKGLVDKSSGEWKLQHMHWSSQDNSED